MSFSILMAMASVARLFSSGIQTPGDTQHISWARRCGSPWVSYLAKGKDYAPVEVAAPSYADLRILTVSASSESVKFVLQMAAPIPKDATDQLWFEIDLFDVFPYWDRTPHKKIVAVVLGSYGSEPALNAGQTAIVLGRPAPDGKSYSASVLSVATMQIQGSKVELEFPATEIPPQKLISLFNVKGMGNWKELGRYLLEARVYCLPASIPTDSVRWVYRTDDICIPPYSGILLGGPEHPPLKARNASGPKR